MFLALNNFYFPTLEVPLSLLTEMLPGSLVIDKSNETWKTGNF